MERNKTTPNQRPLGKKTGFPRLINVLYTALLVFLVFTAANDLVKGIIEKFHVGLLLYIVLWVSMVIQTIFAYKHIREVSYNYKSLAFISDCVDICIFLYVCAAIGSTCTDSGFYDLDTYRHISIPFLILSFNQLCWYIFVKEKRKSAAVLRLILLFAVMLTTTLFDPTCHTVWMLATIVGGNFLIMVVFRAIDWAPKCFINQIDILSKKTKHKAKNQQK